MKVVGINIIAIMAMIFSLSLQAQANDRLEETEMTLKQALMQSNKDYNDHKRVQFSQEHNRVDEWGERAQQAIMIDNTSPQLQGTKIEDTSLHFEKGSETEEEQEVSLDASF